MKQKLCECGRCDQFVALGKRFKRGHNKRIHPYIIPNHHPCACGCGKLIDSDKIYCLNHWRKYPKVIQNHHLCACGKCCILVSSNRTYAHNHHSPHNKGKGKPKSPSQLCACGICGLMTKPGKKFILGHGQKGKPAPNRGVSPSKETIEKRKKSRSWYRHKTETKLLIGIGNTGKTRSQESKEQNRQAHIGKSPSKDTNEKNRQAQLKHWQDPKKRNSHIEGIRIACKDPIRNEKIGASSKQKWADPEWKENQIIACGEGLARKPNRPELYLQIRFLFWHPDISYCGDYSVIINGKNPDFISEERKKIIEFNGSYWHQNDIPGERERIFAEIGYDTLILVDEDLKDEEALKAKVDTFMERPNPYLMKGVK